jgi:hypothetical protein
MEVKLKTFLRTRLHRGNFDFWPENSQNPQNSVFLPGRNLSKSSVLFKKLFPRMCIFVQNYQFRERTVPWPSRMRSVQMWTGRPSCEWSPSALHLAGTPVRACVTACPLYNLPPRHFPRTQYCVSFGIRICGKQWGRKAKSVVNFVSP